MREGPAQVLSADCDNNSPAMNSKQGPKAVRAPGARHAVSIEGTGPPQMHPT